MYIHINIYKKYYKVLQIMLKCNVEGGKMRIRKWTSHKKVYKVKVLKNVGGVCNMAVSMGVLPVLKGEIAKNVLDSLKQPTMDKEFLDRCSTLASKIKKGKSKK